MLGFEVALGPHRWCRHYLEHGYVLVNLAINSLQHFTEKALQPLY